MGYKKLDDENDASNGRGINLMVNDNSNNGGGEPTSTNNPPPFRATAATAAPAMMIGGGGVPAAAMGGGFMVGGAAAAPMYVMTNAAGGAASSMIPPNGNIVICQGARGKSQTIATISCTNCKRTVGISAGTCRCICGQVFNVNTGSRAMSMPVISAAPSMFMSAAASMAGGAMTQGKCYSCQNLMAFPAGAPTVVCPTCRAQNKFELPPVQISCMGCRTLLQLPASAPAVGCPICKAVTPNLPQYHQQPQQQHQQFAYPAADVGGGGGAGWATAPPAEEAIGIVAPDQIEVSAAPFGVLEMKGDTTKK